MSIEDIKRDIEAAKNNERIMLGRNMPKQADYWARKRGTLELVLAERGVCSKCGGKVTVETERTASNMVRLRLTCIGCNFRREYERVLLGVRDCENPHIKTRIRCVESCPNECCEWRSC